MKGSKSITNRSLILQQLTPFKLKNPAKCEDSFYMQEGLKKLKKSGSGKSDPSKLYLGNAGTAVRFLTSYATTLNKEVIIKGSKRMHERPIKPLINALNTLGANISCSKTGCPPIHIQPKVPVGGKVQLPGNISSQYITSLLLISPLLKKGLTIELQGEVCSIPYIEMTIALLKKIGIKVDTNSTFSRLRVKPNQKIKHMKSGSLFIEGDASSASYLGAYAALKPDRPVTIKNIPISSIQGDLAFKKHLKKMGCHVTHKNSTIQIQGPSKPLKALGIVDMNKTPDLVMTFAILAAFAEGKTRITNIANLKIKESNRIQALKTELKKIGTKVKSGKDFIEISGPTQIKPTRIRKTKIKTYNDHRIAMAFGVLKKTILPHLRIENPAVVRKSYPEFWSDLNKLNRNK
jgi:3-phosphoshikimate 1-carboxyvinyltransferase